MAGLTTYSEKIVLIAGGYDKNKSMLKTVFSEQSETEEAALDPSPAWEVAEFLIIALDRSGARVEGAVAALGCYPSTKIGQELFNFSNNGGSTIQTLQLTFNCQFVESAYINDLAARYVRKFAVFGHSNNFNPGAGDAFFANPTNSTEVDSQMFAVEPNLDSVQSKVGNMPVFKAESDFKQRTRKSETAIKVADHSKLYYNENEAHPVDNPYETTASPDGGR